MMLTVIYDQSFSFSTFKGCFNTMMSWEICLTLDLVKPLIFVIGRPIQVTMVTGVGEKKRDIMKIKKHLFDSMLNYVYIYNFLILEYTGDKCYSRVVFIV